GADAVYFASRGYPVHAIDLSPGMTAAIAEKVERFGLQGLLTYQNCSFTELACLVENAPYQYIYSNFGGLNCIGNLAEVSRQITQVLLPGGRLTWVIMPHFCPWEVAHLFKGESKTALRRFHPSGTIANVEGVSFKVFYYTPQQVMEALGADFHLLRLEGLSVFAPPADRKHFARRFPRLYRLLTRIDDVLTPLPPFNQWGDFFILTAEYRP
ncbi:MAG: class I SAM-dependent methyltransferase, partial [Anaerolineaceae bacterium]|nr:class I SAM-dependent methyltransferase [Anaerolineaceae bacterium]